MYFAEWPGRCVFRQFISEFGHSPILPSMLPRSCSSASLERRGQLSPIQNIRRRRPFFGSALADWDSWDSLERAALAYTSKSSIFVARKHQRIRGSTGCIVQIVLVIGGVPPFASSDQLFYFFVFTRNLDRRQFATCLLRQQRRSNVPDKDGIAPRLTGA